MKVLHAVESYYPSVGGMQEVVRQLSERLVRMGHSVTVATRKNSQRRTSIINGVKIEDFQIAGNAARGIQGGPEIERYQAYLRQSDFDVVVNFAAQQWATDLMLPILGQISAQKIIVPTGFSGLYLPEFHGYFAAMETYLKQYDHAIFLSADYRDINFARKIGFDHYSIIPNGASEDEFLPRASVDIRQKLDIPHNHFLILHVGSHTGMKGHREAMCIFRHANIRNATLLMIGNSFGGGCTHSCRIRERLAGFLPGERRSNKQVRLLDLGREETVAAYQVADLFLFPSNIECSPIVLFECMASQTPYLTTDVGNSVEITAWSGGGLVLPTHKTKKGFSRANISESTRLLERLYQDSVLRQQLAQAGFHAWKEKFTWEIIARQYEALYQRLVAGEPAVEMIG